MFETSIPDKTFFQICIIVDDVERYAENYRTILGYDVPSDYQITHAYDHTQALYYGKPMNARAKITSFLMGRVAFELLEPLDDASVWMDYLKQHGPGIHHVAFNVPRSAPAAAYFADHGYQVTQQGLFTGRDGMYTYLDTDKDLGVVIELLEHYENGAHPDAPVFPADKGIGTDIVVQVGIVANDIATMGRRYQEVLELPEPIEVQTPGYDITETTFNGEPTEATAKLAFFDFGQAQLELIQPDHIPSVWRNYLDEKGDSAHHIAFRVEDTQRAVDHFAKHGIGVLQQGLYGDRRGIYTYMDSEAKLGVIFELLENFDQPR
ncbi:MAG: VOC family protein [Anaerolineae bacterium]|nr:VOC family protein [Anaerolineae bacterium]